MSRGEPVLLEVRIKKTTGKAILCIVEDEEVWFPVSQIMLDDTDVELEEGATGTLAVTPWIAEQKGLKQ